MEFYCNDRRGRNLLCHYEIFEIYMTVHQCKLLLIIDVLKCSVYIITRNFNF